jgi:hypothetical protein
MRCIRSIDFEHNRYVTITELDDIIKFNYPQLQSKDLFLIIKKYRSV